MCSSDLDRDGRLRVQTHPTVLFNVGEAVALEFDPRQCSVFARG